MSTHLQSPKLVAYQVDAGSKVTATVIIGNAQAGGWAMSFGTKTWKGSHANPNPIGSGPALKNQILQVATTVVDVNPSTNQLSTVLKLSGGSKGDLAVPQDLAGGEGDAAVFTTLVLFQ